MNCLKTLLNDTLELQLFCSTTGKARRLKQAKEEAQAEVEAYKRERERQYRENEAKVKP